MKTLELSESQHLLWDRLCDERAVLEAREARALANMLHERGGSIKDPWQFDRVARVFWLSENNATNAGTGQAGSNPVATRSGESQD